MGKRKESDSIGEFEVPAEYYSGAQTEFMDSILHKKWSYTERGL